MALTLSYEDPRVKARRRSRVVVAVLWIVLAGLVAVLLARLVGVERGRAAALTMGLLPLLLLAAYPVLLGAALLRRRALGAVALLVVGAHLLLVAPALGADERGCAGTGLRVVVANLWYDNDQRVRAGRALRDLQADVVIVPELTTDGLSGLRAGGLLAQLPHEAVQLRPPRETVGLFSRLPLSSVDFLPVSGRTFPQATVSVGGVPVRLMGVHPFPPIQGDGRDWQTALRDLRGELAAQPGVLVAAGDFNADRDFASFRALLRDGVRDAHDERGRLLARTWPQRLPVLHLDHVLVRDGGADRVAVCAVREAGLPGSDHLAVVADLAVQPASR